MGQPPATPAASTPATLFSPLAIGPLTLQNRIVISPMCQYSAADGSAGTWHRTHLANLALSGAGLLMLEATAVEPAGRITPRCLGLYSDDNEKALAEILPGVRAHSEMPIGIQLNHAGRKASSDIPWQGGGLLTAREGGWTPLAPSAIAAHPAEAEPAALDAAGMKRIRDGFVASARRARRLALDAIELHCAHGYLMHQFLSPLSNRRTDRYGGLLENRLRYPLEVFDAVRAAWPDKPLGVRVSATDWVDGGWDLAQTIEFVQALKKRGCDWIDVSSGGLSPQQKIPVKPHYQIPFARAVREATGLTTMGVGLITDALEADRLIREGDTDLVSLARAILWDPRWPWHAAAQLGASVSAAPQYWRCPPHGHKNVFQGSQFGQR